jgi:adenosine deaminase
MSIEAFIKAMPKVELDLLLEGSIRPDTLRNIADQNNIPGTYKQYRQWMETFAHPDHLKMEPLLQTVANWFHQPDDLTRVVYELGVNLAKQNVRYAEIGFIPILYNHMTFEQVLAALNDGRNRVERGWNVRLNWILQLPRNQIRRVDDIVRWATTPSANKNGIVGIGLMGRDDLPPVSDFERPFQNARKKGASCTVSAGDSRGADGISAAIAHLEPKRIVGGWGVAESAGVIQLFEEHPTGLVVQMGHSIAVHQTKSYAEYPLLQLYDQGIPVILGTGMPTYFNTSLTNEWLMATAHFNLDDEMIRNMGLNAIRYSMLDDGEKDGLMKSFEQEFANLAV